LKRTLFSKLRGLLRPRAAFQAERGPRKLECGSERAKETTLKEEKEVRTEEPQPGARARGSHIRNILIKGNLQRHPVRRSRATFFNSSQGENRH